MLLTTVGTGKHSRSRLELIDGIVAMDVLHAFIYEVQVDFMAGVKRRARETVNSLGTGVRLEGRARRKPIFFESTGIYD